MNICIFNSNVYQLSFCHDAEDVNEATKTTLTSVAPPEARKKEMDTEIATFLRQAFDGMEPMDRTPEGGPIGHSHGTSQYFRFYFLFSILT